MPFLWECASSRFSDQIVVAIDTHDGDVVAATFTLFIADVDVVVDAGVANVVVFASCVCMFVRVCAYNKCVRVCVCV